MHPPPTGSRRRPTLVIVVLVPILLCLGGLVIDRQMQPTLISGPMIQIPEPGSLAIIWTMDAPFARGAVKMTHPDGHVTLLRAQADGQRYEVAFPRLAPGTAYTYSVLNLGLLGRQINVAGPFEATTPPTSGQPFRFLAFGDSGVGNNSQAALAELMTEQKPDLVIHAGDLDQSTGDPSNYLPNFFEPYPALIQSVPFMPVLGNHDCATNAGRPLLDIFVLPENGPSGIEKERYYWFDFGDARFVALDSNKVQKKHSGILTPEQMKTVVAPWLREVLTNCDARWKFVYFHHPYYTGSTHTPEESVHVRDAFVPVFDECRVDMVFVGHNHLYERTAPLRADQIVPDGAGAGVVYITTGTGGAARYPQRQPPPDFVRAYNDKVLGFTCVDLSADRLHLRQIGDDGMVIDEYTIDKPIADPR